MKTLKKFLSMLLMFMLMLQSIPAVFAEGETAGTLSSTVDGFIGVPVSANIPLAFSGEGTLTKDDVTVTAGETTVTDFTLTESGTEYTLNFNDDMYHGVSYKISAFNSEISYTTAYETDVADIANGTSATEGTQTITAISFGRSLEEVTLKLDFTDFSGTSYVRLYNNLDEKKRVAALSVGASGSTFALGHYEYDADGAVVSNQSIISGVAATDIVYITYKDGLVYPFAVSNDGTIKFGTQRKYLKGSTFGAMGRYMKAIKVSAGDTVTDPSYEEVDCVATSTIDGLSGVPVNAKIPVVLSEAIELKPANVKVTSGEEKIELSENDIISNEAETEYTLSFAKGYNKTYTVQIGTGTPITFTTAYDTTAADIADGISDTDNQPIKAISFGRDLTELTLKLDFSTFSGTGYFRLYNNLTDKKRIAALTLALSNNGDITLNHWQYDANGKNGKETSMISEIPTTYTIYITYKDGYVYPFAVSADGDVKYGNKKEYPTGTTFGAMATTNSKIIAYAGGSPMILINNADADGKVTADYQLADGQSCVIICAVYDMDAEKSVLLDAKIKSVSGGCGTWTFNLDTNSKTNLKYKLFAVNNLTNITPITIADEYVPVQ